MLSISELGKKGFFYIGNQIFTHLPSYFYNQIHYLKI